MSTRKLTEKHLLYLHSASNISRLRAVCSHVPWNKGLTKCTDERLRNLGVKIALNASTNAHFGNRYKKFAVEHRTNLSVSHIGKHHLTDESKLSISLKNSGKMFSDETNRKKALFGELNPFYGRHHSDETKKLISLKQKKRWAESRDWLLSKHSSHLPARLRGLMRRPTSFERIVIDIIHDFNLPFKYVGDGALIIANLNPDFISTDGSMKLIEVYARWCHKSDYELNRAVRFKDCGYDVMFLDDDDIRSRDVCKEKICSFLEGVT